MVQLWQLQVDFVLRSFQNRLTQGREGPKLRTLLDEQPVQAEYEVKLPATDERSAHTARLQVKWCKADLARPHAGSGTKHLAPTLAVWVVEVSEAADTVVGREKPIYWRLLTSHPVEGFEQAQRIIGFYIQRWLIEQTFRTIKSKGLDIQSAQLKTAHGLENLTAMALIAAVEVMQLVQARDQPQGLDLEAVFEADERVMLQQLNPTLEGRTALLKNPHPPSSLAFAAWVIARLGGWSGYASQRPPGPITMLNGLRRFRESMLLIRLAWLPPIIE